MCCEGWSNEAATVHADITADHRDVPASCFYCCGMGLSREPLPDVSVHVLYVCSNLVLDLIYSFLNLAMLDSNLVYLFFIWGFVSKFLFAIWIVGPSS